MLRDNLLGGHRPPLQGRDDSQFEISLLKRFVFDNLHIRNVSIRMLRDNFLGGHSPPFYSAHFGSLIALD